jgi:hypothetical protein
MACRGVIVIGRRSFISGYLSPKAYQFCVIVSTGIFILGRIFVAIDIVALFDLTNWGQVVNIDTASGSCRKRHGEERDTIHQARLNGVCDYGLCFQFQ